MALLFLPFFMNFADKNMKITVNGKEQTIQNPVNISELLKINNVAKPEMVSVQLNGNFLAKENFTQTFPKENDEIEFLYFMGGGSLPAQSR